MPVWRKNVDAAFAYLVDLQHYTTSVHRLIMVKTQQLIRFEMYPIPAFDDAMLGFFAIFCHLRSGVNPLFLRLVANWRNFATNGASQTGNAAGV
jgi:hypothetical protein